MLHFRRYKDALVCKYEPGSFCRQLAADGICELLWSKASQTQNNCFGVHSYVVWMSFNINSSFPIWKVSILLSSEQLLWSLYVLICNFSSWNSIAYWERHCWAPEWYGDCKAACSVLLLRWLQKSVITSWEEPPLSKGKEGTFPCPCLHACAASCVDSLKKQ